MISRDMKYLLPAMLALLLAGCGGGDGDLSEFGNTDGNGSPGGQLRMGTRTASGFTNGLVNIGVDNLSAGGSAQVEVDIVEQNGKPYSDPVTVRFSSTCVNQGLADMEASVTTVSGRATTSYTATGCDGTDTITAKATVAVLLSRPRVA